MYIGANNEPKKVSNAYISVNGQMKSVSKIYVGDSLRVPKMAWQAFNGEIINNYQDLLFNDLEAKIVTKPVGENNEYYIIPEDGIYRLEIISPSTQDFMSQLYRRKNMMISGEIQINNTSYSLSGYPNRIWNIKASEGKKLSISTLQPIQGHGLGRGSSYGVQYMKLQKGQIIEMNWLLFDYVISNPQVSELNLNVKNNNKLAMNFWGGDSANNHRFNNCAYFELSSYDNEGKTDINSFSIDTINLTSNNKEFTNLDTALQDFSVNNNSDGTQTYMLYTQDQYIENSPMCKKLGLGADDFGSAIGNYSLYLMLTFSQNYDSVQIEIGSNNSFSGNYPGCFRITPALEQN